ncbi:MAG TPA: hypothetical protein VNR36_11665 [Pseudolysinimonas sp.]|nr:hypothetical protein [Pseudolysinimonas sp.]
MSEGVRGFVVPPDPWALHDPDGDPVDPALGGPLRVSPPSGSTIAPWPAGPDGGAPAVGGHGIVVVATDALLAHAERLDALATALATDARGVAALPPLPGVPVPGQHIASVVLAVRSAAGTAERARVALRSAIRSYAAAEARERARMLQLAAGIAVALSPLIRALVLIGFPAFVVGRLAGFPAADDVMALRRWLIAHPGLITNPAFVEAVRSAAMSIDETVSATVFLPPDAVAEEGARHGFEGVEVGAALLVGAAAPFGAFRDGPVTVDRVATLPGDRGPRGAVERLARVPEGDQVRIERYQAPGEPPRYIVYVGPTETFSPAPGDEPWDLTSNVAGVAGLSAGSIRATEAAMRDAGIAASDEVQFVGFSQGGLVAARLAADGAWNATGLETYGAPTGNIELPSGLAGMAVRNTDDLVPALAGPQLDSRLLQVERQAFAPGSPIPDELPAPAHQRSAYVATATVVDAARSDVVRTQIAAMDAFTEDYLQRDGSRVTVMVYHASRGAPATSGAAIP